MPPGYFDTHAHFFVNLCLAAENSFGALDALLDILSHFRQRIRERLTVLFDEGEYVFDVHFV